MNKLSTWGYSWRNKWPFSESSTFRLGAREGRSQCDKSFVSSSYQFTQIESQRATPPDIEICNIDINYGNNLVLQGASLSVKAGAITALVGPSGCGKSSLLSVINRLSDLQPCRVSGQVLINASDIFGASTDVMMLRRQVGMVFQRPNPFPLSIVDNLRLPLREHGVRDLSEQNDRIEKALRQVGLWEEINKRLKQSALQLSGGQQQRLCIARALVLEPQVLLLDEPCSALDPLSTEVIERLIKRLRGQYTVLMVTHNLAQARRIADDMAVCWVNDGAGCIVEAGPTEQLFTAPQHAITAAYLNGHQG